VYIKYMSSLSPCATRKRPPPQRSQGRGQALGRGIAGRAAIRAFIANRPRDHWQRHRSSNYRFALAADGTSAEAWSDLEMERGKAGSEQVTEVVRARYHDRFALTPEGWRIRLREVQLAG
jgi:hypothetical protein